MELLADILQNSLLETASVEAEKGIIMREKEEVEKLPQEVRAPRKVSVVLHTQGKGHSALTSHNKPARP